MQRHPPCQAVVGNRAARERMAERLHFHHGEVPGSRQFPQCQQADRANTRPQVEHLAGCRVGAYGRPGRQQVIGGEAMASAELKDPPVSGQDVQGDVINHGRQPSQGIYGASTGKSTGLPCTSN